MKTVINVLFVHMSKDMVGNPQIHLLPLGIVALSNLLKKQGIHTEIIHVSLEKYLDPGFQLIEYIRDLQPKAVCFDLHWHYQSTVVMDTIKKIKKSIPEVYSVVGGYTASFFAEEIMREFPAVDFIVRGDAEIPLVQLLQQIVRGSTDFHSIPNVCWREDKKSVLNQQTYSIDQQVLDALNYGDFASFRHYEGYQRVTTNTDFAAQASDKNIFYYNCGRGCSVNCSFCGGSKIADTLINNRTKTLFINYVQSAETLQKATEQKFNVWYTSFDPPGENNNYYGTLFQEIRRRSIKMFCYFECWTLPNEGFIQEFKKTFLPGSHLALSPEVGAERVREINKGAFYSNREFRQTLQKIVAEGINVDVFFTAGLAFETKKDWLETMMFILEIKKINNPKISIFAQAIEYEPGSLWFLERQVYGISSDRRCFMDYYALHNKVSSIGYRTNYLSSEVIVLLIKLMNRAIICQKETPFFYMKIQDRSFLQTESLHYDDVISACEKCVHFGVCSR
jgi:radical SAM superfamily enzyme YgiQ (UPF0313 family)